MFPFVILCGGLATRLGSIAKRTPKCLLEVNGKPFLYYQLKYLEKFGAEEVYLSVGHLSEKFYDFRCEISGNLKIQDIKSDIYHIDLFRKNSRTEIPR